jgi:hypothetical protein
LNLGLGGRFSQCFDLHPGLSPASGREDLSVNRLGLKGLLCQAAVCRIKRISASVFEREYGPVRTAQESSGPLVGDDDIISRPD